MHHTLAIAAAVATAIRFWVVHLPTLVRLTWFPLAVAGVVATGWTAWSAAAMNAFDSSGGSPDVFVPLSMDSFEGTAAWLVAYLIALSASATSVHRYVVLNDASGTALASFPFGRAEASYFAMGVTAYVLICLLWLGHYVTQFEWPVVDRSLVDGVMKIFSMLGPMALAALMFPGETSVLGLPFENYLLWVLLATSASAIIVRIAPWPSVAATEGRYALADTLRLTSGAAGTIVLYGFFLALAALVLVSVLYAAGIAWLVTNPDALSQMLASLAIANQDAAANESVVASAIRFAAAQEFSRFLAGVGGVTLGAVLVSHLHLLLKRMKG